MTQQSTNTNIRAALGKMTGGDLSESSTQLLAALGYRSDVPAPELPGGGWRICRRFSCDEPQHPNRARFPARRGIGAPAFPD